tara:strand:+ start:37957 stop:39108 length:1152 start_codon:yes stop_codon:yes gene_type:complete
MISQDILILIIKYLNKQATLLERNELEKWLKNHNNYKIYKEYVKINYLIDLNMDMFDADDSKKELLELIDKEKKQFKRLRYTRVMKYAAITILFLGIGYFYQQGYLTKNSEIIISQNNITLQLENGDVDIINEDSTSQVIDLNGNVIGSQKGNHLVYSNEIIKENLTYNTLKVPYGKRFKVELSDGTVVNLNAGTSLKYPVKFIAGKNREVFLKGEAFFNVVKDVKHPFIVNTNEVDVRVLGTKFNISSYDEDEDINTVLVEGAVSLYSKETVYDPKTSIVLNPGSKAAWNKAKNHIDITDADIEMSTAWIDGRIIFKHMPFDKITKKLERHYNVKIINKNESLGKDFVTATFDIESVEEVFKVINEIHPIDYTITDNQIIIY